MRRFIAFFGVLLLVLGIRLYNNGLLACGLGGTLSVGEGDPVPIQTPLLIEGPHRLDLDGDEHTALGIMEALGAKCIEIEDVSDIRIFYAYSPRLKDSVVLRGNKVNLMIAVSPRGVAAGTPLLYGSF